MERRGKTAWLATLLLLLALIVLTTTIAIALSNGFSL